MKAGPANGPTDVKMETKSEAANSARGKGKGFSFDSAWRIDAMTPKSDSDQDRPSARPLLRTPDRLPEAMHRANTAESDLSGQSSDIPLGYSVSSRPSDARSSKSGKSSKSTKSSTKYDKWYHQFLDIIK